MQNRGGCGLPCFFRSLRLDDMAKCGDIGEQNYVERVISVKMGK